MDLNVERKKFFSLFMACLGGCIAVATFCIWAFDMSKENSIIILSISVFFILFLYFEISKRFRFICTSYFIRQSINANSYDEKRVYWIMDLFIPSKLFPVAKNNVKEYPMFKNQTQNKTGFSWIYQNKELVLADVCAGMEIRKIVDFNSHSRGARSSRFCKYIFKGLMFACKKNGVSSVIDCMVLHRPYKYHFDSIKHFLFHWALPFQDSREIQSDNFTCYLYSNEIKSDQMDLYMHLISLLEMIYKRTSLKPNLSLMKGRLYVTLPVQVKVSIWKNITKDKSFVYTDLYSFVTDESCRVYDVLDKAGIFIPEK